MISKLKSFIPQKIKVFIRTKFSFYFDYKLNKGIKTIRDNQVQILKGVKDKEIINVIFLAIHDSVWKYEEVYRLMKEDSKFNVKVVVIPLVRNYEGQMDVYHQSLNYFKEKGYKVIESYDSKNKKWIDIKAITNPDIVFFTNPHKLTFDNYYIDNFTDKLTCYVPYAFVVIHSIGMHYGKKFHQVLWKHFVETKYHFNFANSFSRYNNDNVIITGYPSLDKKFSATYTPSKVWKEFNGKAKKIIWAPHHTISGQGSGLDYSSFMEYADFFLGLLNERNDIQIAFKPHPLLKEKLYIDKEWGITKTDEYYGKWDKLPNGQLELGSYLDLFELSDAMIMDSASFISEYLYFDKPILFTMRDGKVLNRFNMFGQKIFDYLYKAKNISNIEHFIFDTVFNNNDTLRISRNKFLNEVLLPKNGKKASENIYNEIKRELC